MAVRRHLPVELIHNIVSLALAEHLDDLLVGTQSEARLPFSTSGSEFYAPREHPDLVESLMVASYQLHHVTSKIVSSFSAPGRRRRSAGEAAEANGGPWLAVAKTRELRALVITHDLTKATQIAALIRLRTGSILEVYRLVFCIQYQLAIAAQMQTWRHVVAGMESILSLQAVHSDRAGNQEIARSMREVLALCPAAFRDVLAPRVSASTLDIAIFHEYDIHVLELEIHWRTITEPEDEDLPAIDACVYELTRLLRDARDASSRVHADWDHPGSLNGALDEERLEVWCTLLRGISETGNPSALLREIADAEDLGERLADAQDAVRRLLADFEPRLELLQHPRAAQS
ncbi:hypothetical protein PsYK624_137120 [Phanerochaete sordida]|uniref:Uncharacterized protein n=1 Tax=Phanerochaete sordida TaxID=48140 RepID=A0A9P3GM24_9APHY|nr:hypothetical protein PsYK624_137120 [Phanerochaete sordida]